MIENLRLERFPKLTSQWLVVPKTAGRSESIQSDISVGCGVMGNSPSREQKGSMFFVMVYLVSCISSTNSWAPNFRSWCAVLVHTFKTGDVLHIGADEAPIVHIFTCLSIAVPLH